MWDDVLAFDRWRVGFFAERNIGRLCGELRVLQFVGPFARGRFVPECTTASCARNSTVWFYRQRTVSSTAGRKLHEQPAVLPCLLKRDSVHKFLSSSEVSNTVVFTRIRFSSDSWVRDWSTTQSLARRQSDDCSAALLFINA